eukprot:1194294-Prorocentrum_minimum.AAC.2
MALSDYEDYDDEGSEQELYSASDDSSVEDADEYGFEFQKLDEEKPKEGEEHSDKINYAVMGPQEITAKQQEIVQSIQSVLSVSPDTATMLLRHFKWSVNRIHEVWFQDEDKVRAEVGLLPREEEEIVEFAEQVKQSSSHPNDPRKTLSRGNPFRDFPCWEACATHPAFTRASYPTTNSPTLRDAIPVSFNKVLVDAHIYDLRSRPPEAGPATEAGGWSTFPGQVRQRSYTRYGQAGYDRLKCSLNHLERGSGICVWVDAYAEVNFKCSMLTAREIARCVRNRKKRRKCGVTYASIHSSPLRCTAPIVGTCSVRLAGEVRTLLHLSVLHRK